MENEEATETAEHTPEPQDGYGVNLSPGRAAKLLEERDALERERNNLRAKLAEAEAERDSLRGLVGQLTKALPEIDLLARVAEALAYRGIAPASDVEKLRVAAGNIRAALAAAKEAQG